MKRRTTTITLTIAALLAMAGIIYASAGFFSPVRDPYPNLGAGPVGVAAAPADLIASEYCTGTSFTNIDKVDCQGGFATIAQIQTPGGGGCAELYMTIAPLVSANAGFTPRDYFVTSGPNIWQLRLPNSPTLFATIPDGGCGQDHTGITFDHEGTFGFNMIVTCKFSGGVWQVDGGGNVTNIGFITDPNGNPTEIEAPAVVPRSFGPFGGMIWVADEDYPFTGSTVPGALHAIDSGGNVFRDIVEWHGAEAVLPIPQNPCFFCSGGELFQAITLDNFGPTGLYQYFPADFTGLGGNVLIPSEAGNGTALVQFDGTNYVTSYFDNIPGGIFEGASFVDCDVPTPTPTPTPTATFTPTPTATATFTPTPTATFTPTATATFTPTATATFTPTATATFTPTATATATATATFTPTPTPTPTPSATAIQVSKITPTGTTCTEFKNGTAETLSSVNYSVKNGVINNVAPGVFFYWVRVTAPAGNNTFRITQTITTGNFSTFFDMANGGSNVFDSNCNSLHPTITQNGDTTTVQWNAPTAGSYFISIKYNASSVAGQPAPSPATVHYDFATTGVPGSTSGLDLVLQ